MLKRALCFFFLKVVARLTISFHFLALGSKRLLIPAINCFTHIVQRFVARTGNNVPVKYVRYNACKTAAKIIIIIIIIIIIMRLNFRVL